MVRRLVPYVLLVLFVLGCSKKAAPPGGDGGTPPAEPRGVDSDPNAVYSVKVRPVQKGDKTDVVRRESGTEVRRGGSNETLKFEKRFEYTEHILELPADAPLPTRLERAYSVARRTVDLKSGDMKPFGFEGKTVVFAKRGAFYSYTVDGRPLPQDETRELDAEFKGADKARIEALLPDGPVKVGERWPLSREILPAFGQGSPDVDYSKSSLSAQFARAYTLDGKQWGQIAFDIDLVIDPDISGGKVRGVEGTRKTTGTLDLVIDGSARDQIMKGGIKAALAGRHKAAETKSEIDGTIERTVRTAK